MTCVCGCESRQHEHHRDPDEFRACLMPGCRCEDYMPETSD